MKQRYFLSLVLLLLISNSIFGQTQPVITSFSPESGSIGSSVTIAGLRFSTVLTNNIVFFGDVKATVTAATATAITVKVPAGASNKPISVTVNRLTASSVKPFQTTYSTLHGTFTNNAFALKSTVVPSTDSYLQGSSMATGDFDDDGNVDLVSSNEYGTSALIFKNTGNPDQPFLSTHTLKQTPNIAIISIATGDVNGDGKLDIITSAGSAIRVYLNTGGAGLFNFSTTPISFSASNLNSLILADIDGDGKLDICTRGSSNFSVFRNTSTTTVTSFAAEQSISLGNGLIEVKVQDMDGDLKPDVIFNYESKFGIIRNISTVGTIAFSAKVEFSMAQYKPFTVVDVDGDSKFDVVVADDEGITVFKNTSTSGNITMAAPQAIAVGKGNYNLTVGDLNGDGKPDIVLSNSQKKFRVLANNSGSGNIDFVASDIYYVNSYVGRLVLADWNNDGRLDLGINHASTTASVFVNQIDAPAINSYQVNPLTGLVTIKGNNFIGITEVKFGGINALNFTVVSETEITANSPDNIQGVISVIGTNGVANHNGFTNVKAPIVTAFTPLTGPAGSSITITGENFSSTITENKVYFGTVAGVVTAASPTSLTVIVPTGASYSPIAVLTKSLKAVSSHFFNVTFGDGTATFPTTNSFVNSNTTLLTANTYVILRNVAASDFNGDGTTDLLVGDYQYLDFYSNTRDPIAPFKVRPNLSLQLEAYSNYHLADLNGDGKLDIITPYADKNVNVYKNTSSLTTLSFEKKEILGAEVNRGSSSTVITADLDQDGKLDLVVFRAEDIMIYRNAGTIEEMSFSKVPTVIKCPYFFYLFSSGRGFQDVKAIDLDGDGKQDLVASYYKENAGVGLLFFKNTSENGVFTFTQQYEFPNLPSGFAFHLADFNSDGLPDIAITVNAGSQNLRFLENTSENGNISFVAGSTYTIAVNIGSPVFGDLDGDGKPDLVMPNINNKISVLKNIGTGNTIAFGTSVEFTVGTNPGNVAIADINNDGKLDLAIIDGSSTSGQAKKTNVLFNMVKQPTLLAATVTVPGVNNTVKLSGTNLIGTTTLSVDGISITSFEVVSDTEIIAQFSEQLSGTIKISSPYGIANLYGFSSRPIPLIQSFSPSNGKINTIVTITGLNFDPISVNNIVFFGAVKAEVINATTTSIIVKVPAGANYLPISVATRGLVAYSKKPFVVTYDNGASVFLKRNAFTPKEDLKTKEPGIYIATDVNSADLDGDGRPDLITAKNIFRNTGDPLHPFNLTEVSEPPFSGRLAFADLDGDGKLDVISIGGAIVKVYRNTSSIGNFSFEPNVSFSVGLSASDIAVGDIDGDGKIDIVTSNQESNTVSVLRNITIENQLNFAAQQDYATGNSPSGVCVGDFDNDGKLDIATSNRSTYNISVLKNNGLNGVISFATKQDYSTNDATTSIAVGDLDGDDKLDLVTTSFEFFSGARDGAIFKNLSTNGTISFSARIAYYQQRSEQHMNGKLADLDGDGKPDLIASDFGLENVYLYPNRSTSTTLAFGSPVSKALIANQVAREAVVGDWNLDGKPDLAIKNGPWVSILLNQASLTTPEIIGFSPAAGGENSTITLTGNFFDNATSVTFGGGEAKSFTVVSSTSIKAVVAFNSGPVNPQDVIVTTPQGIALIEGFTYVRKPVVTSYTVDATPPNYTITINGTNFTDATEVSFGGVQVTSFVVNSINKITAISAVPVSGDLSVTTAGGTVIYPTTLPVNLVFFSARLSNRATVQINWSTALEENNDFFTLYRSGEDKSFKEIGKYKSRGSNASYAVTDYLPFNGVNYYQLVQTDKDGKISELGMQQVRIENLVNSELIVYPNPIKDGKLTVEGVGLSGIKLIKVYDLMGRLVLTEKVSFVNDRGALLLNTLTKGIYLMKVDETFIKVVVN